MNDYRLIALTKGQWAIVDASDYDWLNQWRWFAWRPKANSTIFYAKRRVRNDDGTVSIIGMHNLILDTDKGMVGDHWNGDTLDCRRCNLRQFTRSQNALNRHGSIDRSGAPQRVVIKTPNEIERPLSVRNTSGHQNVTRWQQTKWISRIVIRGTTYSLGVFDTAEEASAAYQQARAKLKENPRYRPKQKLSSRNRSGHKGVSWHRAAKKWRVTTTVTDEKGKRHVHIGSFDTIKKAIAVRRKFERTERV